MKLYLAGSISNCLDTYKEKFRNKTIELENDGYIVMDPSILPLGFEHHEYLHINKAMIDVCDIVYFMPCWKESIGAQIENNYAISNGKEIIYEVCRK